jgi:hypothetical protein
MKLKYTVNKSHLPQGTKYYSRLVERKVVDQNQLLKELRKDTALEQHDIKSVLEQLETFLGEMLLDGDSAHTPLGIFSLVAKGALDQEDQPFQPQKVQGHSLEIRFKATPSLNRRVKSHKAFERVLHPTPAPVISRVNKSGTPGRGGLLTGRSPQDPGGSSVF